MKIQLKTDNMKNLKIEIKWAIIFVATVLLWMLLEKLTGLHDEHIDKHATYTSFIAIPAVTIYVFALLDKRKNFYNGVMSYKQAFITGMVITLIVAVFNPLTQIVTSTIISPDFFSNIINYSVSKGLMAQEAAGNAFNLKSYIFQGTIGALIMGLITSAIVAIFTRNKKSKLKLTKENAL